MSTSPRAHIGTGVMLLHFLKALFWSAPVGIAQHVARAFYDRTLVAVVVAALPLAAIVATAVGAWGAAEGRWGADVSQAWANEAVASRNADVLRARLERHRGEVPAGHEQYEAWVQQRDRLKARISEAKAYIPSVLLPWAPLKPFATTVTQWSLLYQSHHFLFGSIYPPLFLLYGLIGAGLGWKRSTRWRRRQWKRADAKTRTKGLLLGLDDDGRSHHLAVSQRVRHALVSGTTGSGKTEALKTLVRDDLLHGRGVFFMCMKGDRGLSESVFGMSAECGRAADYSFFSFEEGFSHSYAALAQGDVLAIRDRLMSAGSWSEEPFYRNECKAALGRLLKVLIPRGLITFEDICLCLDEQDAYELVRDWADAAERGAFERDLSDWSQFRRNTSGLRSNLEEFVQMGSRLCSPLGDIDLRDVYARSRIAYFELNSQMRKEAASGLARLILEDLKCLSGSLAASPPGLRKPFSVYLDEASNAVYEGFSGLISQCRSAGFGLVVASQSPLDFGGIKEGVGLAVVQNTATKLLFCQRDSESAQACSDLGGTRSAIKRTSQVVDDGLFPAAGTGVHSEREGRDYCAHPDEMKSLPTGRAFLIQDQTRAFIETQMVPAPAAVRFAPLPVRFEAADKRKLGRNRPPLNVKAHLEAQRKRRAREEALKCDIEGESQRPGSRKKKAG